MTLISSSSSVEYEVREDLSLNFGSGFTGFIDNQNAAFGWDKVTRGCGAGTATGFAGPEHKYMMSASTATNHVHPNVRTGVEVLPLVFCPPDGGPRLDKEDNPFVMNNKRARGGKLPRLPRARKKLVDLLLNATTAPILPRLESFCRIHRRLILCLQRVRRHGIEIPPEYPAKTSAAPPCEPHRMST